MTKPRILYLVHNFDNLAGVEIHTKTLWSGLAPWFDTFIVHPEQIGPAEFAITVRSPAGKIERYPADPVHWPTAPQHLAKNEASLKLVLDSIAPDLIHIQHFIHWPLSVIDQCADLGKPLYISFHDYFAFTPNFTMIGVSDPLEAITPAWSVRHFGSDISRYLKQRLNLIARSVGRAEKLITPAPYLARIIERMFQKKVDVIEIGIDPFDPLPRLITPQGARLKFGYVGSMIPQKGWDFLAQNFRHINARYPETELLMFGGGEPPPLSFPGVRFLGGYRPDEIPSIMAQFDVGIIPSIFAETFSMLLSEMWRAGRPVAVSDIGALGERVTSGVNGRKFAAGNVGDLTASLLWFIEHDEWRGWRLPRPRLRSSMLEQYRSTYESSLQGGQGGTDHG